MSLADTHQTMDSDFLVARPSTLGGAARLIDLWGFYNGYNQSRNGAEADARAMYADWRVTGEDLYRVLEQEQLARNGQQETA